MKKNYSEIKRDNKLEEVLNKYNPVLSARDMRIEKTLENEASDGFPYTEEDHSYDEPFI